MPYLFQISLGPVQSFIQEARRTRDLKFGSWFLNEIAWVAAKKVAELCGSKNLIFPALLSDQTGQSEKQGDAPNKILAYVDTVPADLAVAVKQAIDERVEKLKENAFQKIESRIVKASAEKQIQDLVEYVWATLPFDKETDPYKEKRQALDALVAARKNTRDFSPVEWGDSSPKSSIDGKLECVIRGDEYPRLNGLKYKGNEEKRKIYQQVHAFRDTFGAGPHEKLSGIDLLKRLGEIEAGEKTFPSTSHMAALPFLTGLQILSGDQQQIVEKWKKDYFQALEEAKKKIHFELDTLPARYQATAYWPDIFSLERFDGALLYPERFPDVVGDSQMFQDAQKAFQNATNILETFFKHIQLRPTPYYALLVADGDRMGAVIQWQSRNGMEKHQALSRALSQFAGKVAGIVKNHRGVCIYAGGDDVLALLPLHRAIQCASELADKFSKELEAFHDEDGKSPTLSVGLAVVHHLHPLGDALRIARDAESRAKKSGRNALAITVQKRGGPPCVVGGTWDRFDRRLAQQIDLCQNEIIPSGMAYELEEAALRLEPELDNTTSQPISLPHVQFAALRVFQRKLIDKHKERKLLRLHLLKRMIFSEEALEQEQQNLQKLLTERRQKAETLEARQEIDELERIFKQREPLVPVSVTRLADELIVARLFAQARNLAAGQRKGVENA